MIIIIDPLASSFKRQQNTKTSFGSGQGQGQAKLIKCLNAQAYYGSLSPAEALDEFDKSKLTPISL